MASIRTSAMAKSSLVAGVLLIGAMALLMRGPTVADTAQRWGLLGTWAADCVRPASDDAPRTRYLRRDGGKAAMERRYADRARNDVSAVGTAVVGADGTITLTLDVPGSQQTRIVVLTKSGDRVRTMSDRVVGTNGHTVRDGRFVHDGRETPWQQRCDG
jgi:hypothetical protein